MPKRPNGLVKRGSIWRCRKRVPDELRQIIGRSEILHSLNTSDYELAKKKHRMEMLKIEQEIDAARRSLEAQQTTSVDSLSDEELDGIILTWFAKHDRQNHSDYTRISPEEIDEIAGLLGQDLTAFHYELPPQAEQDKIYNQGLKLAESLLKEHSVSPDRKSPKFARVHELVVKGLIESHFRRMRDLGARLHTSPNRYFSDIDHLSSSIGNVKHYNQSASRKLSKLMDSYAQKARLKNKTEAKYRGVIAKLSKFLGRDAPIAQISHEDFVSFRDSLGDKYSVTTINTHFDILSSIFQHAFDCRWVERNWAARMNIRQDEDERLASRRMPFNTDELKSIFNAPLYTGCVDDERGYSKPGKNHPRGHRFWIPLIGLFTGMRINEICQLYVEDFKVVEEVSYFSLSRVAGNVIAKDKHLKTKASRRDVPIHPELMAIGLAQHVNSLREQGESRMFPKLSYNAKTERSSDTMSKWFGHFLASLGLKESGRKISFHSFRHAFADAARNAGIHEEYIEKIGGWSLNERVSRQYGHGVSVTVLYQELARIQFHGLDLSHLHVET